MKDVGGWTFTPDLAWANVQTYAFHYFHTLMSTQGFVVGRGACGAPVAGAARRRDRADGVCERAGLRRPALARHHGLQAVLRRARPLLRKVRLLVALVVGVVERVEVQGMQYRRDDLHHRSLYPPFSPSYP